MSPFGPPAVPVHDDGQMLYRATLRQGILVPRLHINPQCRFPCGTDGQDSKLSADEAVRLAAIPRLTPGDFRTVRQGFFYLGDTVTNADYLAALERESAAKEANCSAARDKVGF